MAYGLRYQSIWTNELQQDVTISIFLKDYVGDADSFISQGCKISTSSDDKSIISAECRFDIFADNSTDITWETFLAGSYDEWKVVIECDGHKFFEGFLTPEEGSSPFLDKPYGITLRAANGLKLLKGVPFPTIKGKYLLSDLLAMALEQTLLELPIRVYGSIYNADMNDREDDIAATYWNQVKFDHRTLLKDATTFLSCYDVLLKLLSRHSRLMYFKGKWLVFYTPELQYAPGGLFYTDFDKDGVAIGGAEDVEGYATIGKAEAIYPINEDGLISSLFPIKFARTTFPYEVYPEIPLNSKFSNGTLIGTGIDTDGNPYEDWTIDDWTSGRYEATAIERNALPNFLNPNPDPWYRRSTFNQFGVEIRRELIIERATAAGGRAVQSPGEPVNKGDIIRFNTDWRASIDLGEGDSVPVQITPYIEDPITGTLYVLRSKDGQVSEAKWEPSTPQMVGIYTTPNGDLVNAQSLNIESPAIPVDGTLYYLFWCSVALGDNTATYYRGFSMEYIPFIAGGFVPVRADYWQHTQNKNELDKDEGDIPQSDSVIRVLQGCMFKTDGVTATTPTWYRYGLTESRHFKELVNLARYNFGYRRFYRIEGTFKGLLYSPINDQLNFQPISFHKIYQFSDMAQPRLFILSPQIEMDLATAEVKATFEEVVNPALTHNIGARMSEVINGLIAMVTNYFGSQKLFRFPPDPRMLKLITDAGTVIGASADDNGVGNAPSFIVNTQFDEGANRIAILTLGEDIAIGNIFELQIGGDGLGYTVVDNIVQADGTQEGDTQEFNFIFAK